MLKLKDFPKAWDEEIFLFSPKVFRPWGSFTVLGEGPGYKIKRLEINPRERLSLQFHRRRSEYWLVVSGQARVTRGDEVFLLQPPETTFIPQGLRHRLENPGTGPVVIIEVQSGDYLGEDDIVRLDDIYGRRLWAPTCDNRK